MGVFITRSLTSRAQGRHTGRKRERELNQPAGDSKWLRKVQNGFHQTATEKPSRCPQTNIRVICRVPITPVSMSPAHLPQFTSAPPCSHAGCDPHPGAQGLGPLPSPLRPQDPVNVSSVNVGHKQKHSYNIPGF